MRYLLGIQRFQTISKRYYFLNEGKITVNNTNSLSLCDNFDRINFNFAIHITRLHDRVSNVVRNERFGIGVKI